MWKKVKSLILDILFPQFCFNCGVEGTYLCEDCKGIIEISGFHQKYSTQNLKDLYFATNYQNPLVKNLIQKFKYEPLVKELTKPLSFLIMAHFQLMDNRPKFSDFVLVPVPLEKRKLKWRGFNQAEEIGKELAEFLRIPLIANCLIKIKETMAQAELVEEARKGNVKGAFLVKNQIRGKKILLVDDVYTTGATMEECAKVLKESGVKEIIGVVIARG